MSTTTPRSLALGALLAAVLASPAAAAERDDGPYTPFPEGNPDQRAADYVRKLNERRITAPATRQRAAQVNEARLAKGTSLPGPGTTPPDERGQPKTTFARAGVSETGGDPKAAALPFVLIALVLATAAVGFERRARRRSAGP